MRIFRIDRRCRTQQSFEREGHVLESLTACICTHNRATFLPRLLEVLQDMAVPAGLSFEVLVVDNASSDETPRLVQDYVQRNPSRFVYVREEKLGLSHARNLALRTSSADVIAFIDDDAIPRSGWLPAIIEGYSSGHDVGVVGGQVLLAFSNDAKLPRWFGKALYPHYSHREFEGEKAFESHRPVDDPYGANIAFRRSLALDLGGFNVNLGRQGGRLLGGEETQLCQDIRSAGYRVLLHPRSVVDHFIPAGRISLKQLLQQAWCDGEVSSIWTIGPHSGLTALQAIRALPPIWGRFLRRIFGRSEARGEKVALTYELLAEMSAVYHRWRK